MTNEMKLLRAFIEASGFDIETKITIQELHNPRNSSIERLPDLIDYKVTKRDAAAEYEKGRQADAKKVIHLIDLHGFSLSEIDDCIGGILKVSRL